MFTLLADTPSGRHGRLETMHGTLQTPVFFPVGTGGAMRGVTFDDLNTLGAQSLLCNTYHLHLQPGEDVIEQAGGLHQFIGWDKPILTDSGGFQVFSLRDMSKIEEHGVHFKSHIDGRPLFLGPEEAMRIQHKLGSDIIMCFDECPASTASREVIEAAVDRTLRWAKECKRWHAQLLAERVPKVPKVPTGPRDGSDPSVPLVPSVPSVPLLFGIIQGGLDHKLRQKCAEELIAIGFDGYAVGGLAVGETEAEMYDVLDAVCPVLPKDKPRYLMGVGRVDQHRAAIARGIDIFDCVLPMREARHGKLYMSDGTDLNILNAQYKTDHSAIDAQSPSPLSRTHKKSYLHHLFKAKERMAETIACNQNLGITLQAIDRLRGEISHS